MWTPEIGERYYYFDRRLIVKSTIRLVTSTIYSFDKTNFGTLNCFQTEDQCQGAIEGIKEYLKNFHNENSQRNK